MTSRSWWWSVGQSTMRMSCSYSASEAPARIDAKYGAATIGSITPISPVRPPERARALRLAVKPWSRTTRRTAPRVSAATPGRSLSTRDTVAIETPAALAISRMVARALPFSSVVLTTPLKQISGTGYKERRKNTSFGFTIRPINNASSALASP